MEKQKALHYRFEIKGIIGSWMHEWFEDMNIQFQDERTIIEGNLQDQSHLHGVLNRVRDLNLDLISVTKLEKMSDVESDDHEPRPPRERE
mgnify:CR=1 FL=1